MSGQLVITQIQHSCILQFTDLRRLRLAITITDAGEFPMFIGMHPVKSLSFRKMASRFFSKMDAGIGPMNLLKRRSKYLNVGSSRISVGNRPENSLLLASNSCILPVNRLLLRCTSARSARRPSSSGKVPHIPAPLRSIPETVRTFGSSGADEQYTPV